MTLTAEELQAIRARTESATEGPWAWDADKFGDLNVYSPELRGFHNNGGEIAKVDFGMHDDADFIAASRQDVPKLLAEVDRLREVLDDAYGEILRDKRGRVADIIEEWGDKYGDK